MTQLYKVLVDGKSCHGGNLEWSLPRDGQPGEWQAVAPSIKLVKCSRGLHLTDDPARWWKPNCVVYLVDAEEIVGSCDDEVDRKVVCRRARLTREATIEELNTLRIWHDGVHYISDAQAAAWDSATVEASGSATVKAWDSATVEAWDSATVEASGSATVKASGSATVKASGLATVEASGSATVKASGSAMVTAWDSATVEAWDSATVKASGSATVTAWGSATVTASGLATVEASGSATVISWGTYLVHRGHRIEIAERAVWIERGDGEQTPIIHTVVKS